jgi:F0F1-type ATP synthase assembly protein I
MLPVLAESVKCNMFIIAFEFISGFMIGVELVSLEDIYDNVKGWAFCADVGIIRIVIEKRSSE